jgi:hypothetical protein
VSTFAERIGMVGGICGILTVLGSTGYFLYNSVYTSGSSNANLAAQVANLVDQVRILAGREDKGSADTGELFQRIRVIENQLNAIPHDLADLKAQLHSLDDKTNEALSIASRRPPTVVNPLQQRCADLAEEAFTGRGYRTPETRESAINLMRILNCGATQH